jgi:BON domain
MQRPIPRRQPARRRRPAGPPLDSAERRELLGRQPAEDQNPFLDNDELDTVDEPTDTAIYEGDLEAEGGLLATDPDNRRFESLTDRELRAGETDDAAEAAEEGLTFVPASDPPLVAGDDGQPEVAAGFATSATDDEPFDADHHSQSVPLDDEVSERVRDALRADALATEYADELDVETDGRVVILRGRVADLDDEDAVVAAAERVAGVSQVIDELEVAGVG